MNEGREIVTLQFGNFANHIGTHFWNIQEFSFNYDPDAAPSEIYHDTLFREGATNKNQITFTPRMLLVDLKGTLKFMPDEGTLYTNPSELQDDYLDQLKEDIAWDSKKIEVIKQETQSKPELQKDLDAGTSKIEEKNYNLKDTITNWPEYMYSRYHPRTMNFVRAYNYCEEYSTFDTFTIGQKLWETEYFEDDFCDKIRMYVEECDSCQGFQTIFDGHDGFSGLSLQCLEYLQDEYSKTLFALPVFPPTVKNFQSADEAMSDTIRLINIFFTYANLSEHCDLFVPLSTMSKVWRNLEEPRKLPNLKYEPTNIYHSSAVLATFLDTISLRYRLKNPSHSNLLPMLCADMNGYGRKMASARIACPFPMNDKEDLIDFLDRFEGELMQSLTPGTQVGTDRIIQNICIRGIPKTRLKRPLNSAKNQMKMAAYRCNSVSEMMQLYYQCNNYASMAHVTAVETAMNVKLPFPMEFFDQRMSSSGFTREFEVPDEKQVVSEVPTMAAIQTSNDLANTLENLHQQITRVKIRKIPRFFDAGLELEEYKETIEKLLVFKEQYEENLNL